MGHMLGIVAEIVKEITTPRDTQHDCQMDHRSRILIKYHNSPRIRIELSTAQILLSPETATIFIQRLRSVCRAHVPGRICGNCQNSGPIHPPLQHDVETAPVRPAGASYLIIIHCLWLSADQNWVDPGWSQSLAQRPDQQEENSCGGERLFGSNFSVDNSPSIQPC